VSYYIGLNPPTDFKKSVAPTTFSVDESKTPVKFIRDERFGSFSAKAIEKHNSHKTNPRRIP